MFFLKVNYIAKVYKKTFTRYRFLLFNIKYLTQTKIH